MTDIAERLEEIDEAKAQAARDEAKRRLQEKDQLSDVAFGDATALLEKSLARLKVVRKRRNQ
jgi:F-type H+-transporting ATPase subunit epsilon